METVAFYSYKGGVGRSLFLANAARFLATLGNGVVALDFDFEAPGLHYKLSGSRDFTFPGGAVPYLVATAEGADAAPPLEDHMVPVPVPPEGGGWLRLMPAGPAPHEGYWASLKELGDKLRLDDPSGRGFMALLDLQARIAEELKPDYLLIDARTGVTELGSLATTVLADTVVSMFVPNHESLDGTLAVVEALKSAPRLKSQKPIRVVPVLSRATSPSDDDRFAHGVARLLELAAGKKANGENPPTLFALPHDEALAGSDRIVGGERIASAFTPLYKAYLELAQTLFPARAEHARNMLQRLGAVAGVKDELTGGLERYYASDTLQSPWSPSDLDEGAVCEAERYPEWESRYADIVCRAKGGSPLMVVEYVGDSSPEEALEFWKTITHVRCVVLLAKNKRGATDRQIFTRESSHETLHRAERWDLPLPREFELLGDVGDRSVETMLNAARRGHVEAVAWLVDQWLEYSISGLLRGGRPRPAEARHILDGLAAVEDLRCAEEVLHRAEPGGYPPRRDRFRDDAFPWEDVDQALAEGLFAPLYWRLPVEAALAWLRPRRYPGEGPPLGGYQLLAEQTMGLRYNPQTDTFHEARSLAAHLGHDDHTDDQREIHRLHRRHRERTQALRLSDEAPPTLVWDEVLRSEPYWQGSLKEARGHVSKKLSDLLASSSSLRSRLSGLARRNELAIQGLLGQYDGSGGLDLYSVVINAAADVLGVSPRYLKSVAFIYLSVWAMAHQARDLDGHRGYGFTPSSQSAPFVRESPAHVSLVHAFTDRFIRHLQDPNLLVTFENLSSHLPKSAMLYGRTQRLPLERLRDLLMKARASPSALGLPLADAEG